MTSKRIVVGVDGSAASKAALRWAVRQAEMTGAVVDAVIAWNYPVNYGWAMALPDGADEFDADAEKVLAETIAEVRGPDPAVEVRMRTMQGHAARVLLDSARGADLLVVGSRGRGGFTGLLLGSVSTQCVHHAKCPVVVVREAPESSAAGAAS